MNQKTVASKIPVAKSTDRRSSPPAAVIRTVQKPKINATKSSAAQNDGSRQKSAQPTTPATKKTVMDATTIHNREQQLNLNNERFWTARGHDKRPDNWETLSQDSHHKQSK
ncbi:hypothetical protein [Janthinobacterium sp. P210006]|uniref:hypothetical protein n=1 Tax=Janthinobacterium sp. P210006 TaxID=3112939 RepID=UPI002E255B9A|nr:hypothetical protein [Janthinobacterium sp. P210006]